MIFGNFFVIKGCRVSKKTKKKKNGKRLQKTAGDVDALVSHLLTVQVDFRSGAN